MLAPKEIILVEDCGAAQCSKTQTDFIFALCRQHGGNEKLVRFIRTGNTSDFKKRLSMTEANKLIGCLNQNLNWRFVIK